MFNLYINTKHSVNKGSFKIDYRHSPLNFATGTKMAFNNMLIFNTINNISANLGNNVIYIHALAEHGLDGHLPTKVGSADSEGFFETEQNVKDLPIYDDIRVKYFATGTGDTTNDRIYKITLPDGQYSITALDEIIARRLCIDLTNTILHTIVADIQRKFMITAEPTFSKIRIMSDRHNPSLDYLYDIVFPPTWTQSQLDSSIAHFLGIKKIKKHDIFPPSTPGIPAADRDWYSFNKTKHPDTSGLGIDAADVNNNITSFNIRVKGGIFYGGYDQQSHESDILHSFNMTSSPGYPQNVAPNNLVFLDVLAVERPINYLDFRITDQNGREIGTDVTEDLSMVITIKEPAD